MLIDQKKIVADMTALAKIDPVLATAWQKWGTPAPRSRPAGYQALLRTIVSQQISTAAAATVWGRLEERVGKLSDPAHVLAADMATLRAAGLSLRKAEYAKSLAEHVLSRSLPLDALPVDDEEAITLISSVRGLGRWSAEVYLLFAEGRTDVFPAGDRALQLQAGQLYEQEKPPTEKALRQIAEPWRPHRGVAALFLWHCYNAMPL